MRLRVREKEMWRADSRVGCPFCRCFIIKIGGDAPCAPIYSVKVSGLGGWWWTNVRARRWRRWYDQVIPLSELSAARGYLQSVLFFFVSFRGGLTSRLVTPSRSHRNEYTRGSFLACGRIVWRVPKDFSLLSRNACNANHWICLRHISQDTL